MSEADDKFASDAVKRKVNMKKFLMTLALGGFALGASAQQIYGDFDKDWLADTEGNAVPTKYDSKRPGKEPFGWTASNVKQKVMLPASKELVFSDANRDAKKKGHSVRMVNEYVGVSFAGSNAPAYITIGKPWVYAVYDIASCDGGTLGGRDFKFIPDAITGYYKSANLKAEDPAKVIVYAWKGSYTSTVKSNPNGSKTSTATATVTDQDRVIWNQTGFDSKSKDAELISKSELAITDNTSEWKQFTLPLSYLSNNVPEKINVIISATNYWNRNSIQKEGTLWVDDVYFVYYHALSELKYNGVTLDGFSESKYDYDLSTEDYDPDKLDCKEKGRGATVEKSFDEVSKKLTITVKGNDYSVNKESVTTYTIQFRKSEAKIYKNSLLVDAHDMNQGGVPQLTKDAQIKLNHDELKDSYDLLLEDFSFAGMSIGDIYVKDVAHTTKDGIVYLKEDGKIVDVNLFGEVQPLPLNVDAILDGSSLVATIVIPLDEETNTNVDVTFAPLYEATPAKALTIPADGLGNVTFNRTFYKGWNTFVAPFPVTKAQLGYDKVNTLAAISTSAGWLKFEGVADETLKANVPYLLYYSADQTPVEFYYGGTVLSTTGEVKTTADGQGGAKVSMVGNYKPQSSIVVGNYLLTELSGEDVIVKAGSKATVDATKCYFTFENVPNPAALSVKFGGDVTGMGNVVAEETAPRANGVYNLQGVKLSNGSVEGLPAGLYIVNGRKVLVK